MYSAEHVRAHVFLCALACCVEWYLRQRLAPILFEDHYREGAEAKRTSLVQKAEVSDSAKQKADTATTQDGLPVTACAPCRTISDPSPSTRSLSLEIASTPLMSQPNRPRSSSAHSSCSNSIPTKCS